MMGFAFIVGVLTGIPIGYMIFMLAELLGRR